MEISVIAPFFLSFIQPLKKNPDIHISYFLEIKVGNSKRQHLNTRKRLLQDSKEIIMVLKAQWQEI